ncbi:MULTISPECIES: Pycsar system effector family protein [Micrococcaceae]|jgi:hypothetical protein|uniref:Pycsar system effector family protein n=1 Tax=Micrococcaceae TaxID=1268 RepID=UPI00105F4C49|nr:MULTISPECIES: Pycsar system effector family protein [Micrococcaceae]TDT82269.1 hypothetical protein DFO47_102192 [Arthrobacter sp. AG258]
MRRGKNAEAGSGKSDKDALDTAWRIHGALVDWTGKVDAKASFAFALESAGLAMLVTLSGKDRLFNRLEGPVQEITYYGAGIALILAAGCAMWVVIPRLRMWHVKKEWRDNFIYFGHLKFWPLEQLPAKIKDADMLPILSNQMVRMSKIAWTKHLLVKSSLILASVAGGGLITCAALVRLGLTP